MPTVVWCFREVSTVNLIVTDILLIRAEMNSGALITPSVLYHPGLLNQFSYDASRHF